MNDNVYVTSMVGGRVVLLLPHLHFSKAWPKKGSKLLVPKAVLRDAIFEAGVENMFRDGILYIDDMDFKIELGLEEPDTTTPKIIALDDKYLNRLLRLMPIAEMRKAVEGFTQSQKQELVDYTIQQDDLTLDRINAVSELCKVNVMKAITLRQQKKEE